MTAVCVCAVCELCALVVVVVVWLFASFHQSGENKEVLIYFLIKIQILQANFHMLNSIFIIFSVFFALNLNEIYFRSSHSA